ncbi:MAG: CBS domain-containing protein [Shimia sp.]|nr:CBS domain-containing protein [Shimia sp.]MCP4826733.1 CBS domain-containing protein [Shimia sp.]|mmetsp:Transcript_22909/g.38430  ORF Transcript_22909/g.38430 Transcript_22909/m.38430 type:complete len:174 (+) Transcript_22909:8825-9346(+)
MPSSYQAPNRNSDDKNKTVSQSRDTNTSSDVATVQKVLDQKGGNVFSIRPQDTLGDAVKVLRDRGIGALLVTDANGVLQGILSERDIVRKLAETPGQTLPQQVSDVMTSEVQTCTPNEPMVSVLRRMTEGRFRHMPIADETGLIGMVTIGDLVNYRLTELEHEALQLKQLIVG